MNAAWPPGARGGAIRSASSLGKRGRVMVPPPAAASTWSTPSAKPAGAPVAAVAPVGDRDRARRRDALHRDRRHRVQRPRQALHQAPGPGVAGGTAVHRHEHQRAGVALVGEGRRQLDHDGAAERAVGRIGSGWHVVTVGEDDDRLVRLAPQDRDDVAHRRLLAVAGRRPEGVDRRRRADVDERLRDDPGGEVGGLRAGRAIGDVGDALGQRQSPIGVEGGRRVGRQIDARRGVQADQRDQQRDARNDQSGHVQPAGDQLCASLPAAARLTPSR